MAASALHAGLVHTCAQVLHKAACMPRRAVLVGDPQQLPATVLSKAARAGLLERSLFERLQKLGHPVTVLSVQYRMHPAIRSFPSDFFYQGRLQDSCVPLFPTCRFGPKSAVGHCVWGARSSMSGLPTRYGSELQRWQQS